MKIFLALFCSCTHESDYGVISAHKSKEGAEKVVEARMELERIEWHSIGHDTPPTWVSGKTQEFEVLP